MDNLYTDEHYELAIEETNVFVKVKSDVVTIKDFQTILSILPRVEIHYFAALQQAFAKANHNTWIKFGFYRPLVECEINSDEMEAKVRIHQVQEELDANADIVTMILQSLTKAGVNNGIVAESLKGPFVAQKWFVVARGVPPVNGEDAVINYFPLPDKKPRVESDGKADHYDIHFIEEVKRGDWLGEKIPPTNGEQGITVKGKPLPPMSGKERPIRYDPKTISIAEENGKYVLRALVDGIVEWKKNKIAVSECLTIAGDVGVATGNIDYSGAVVIHGTIQDTYSVVADGDISILSPLGIGMVNKVVSKNGDVYIKGGIHGHNRAVVEAHHNIYAKHVNECVIKAGNEAHIGYYAMGCDITANTVLLNKDKGKLIGGHVHAESKVVAAYIGNEYERVTEVSVQGFDRELLEQFYVVLKEDRAQKIILLDKLERIIENFEMSNKTLEFNDTTHQEYEMLLKTKEKSEFEVQTIEMNIENLSAQLKTKGEGAVAISKKAFPKTQLTLKQQKETLKRETRGTFFIDEQGLHYENGVEL